MIGDILYFPLRQGFSALGIIIALIVLVFWIWMIVDAVKRKFRNDVEKIVWIVIIVLTSWVGALVYYLVIKVSNPKGLTK